MGVVSTFQWDKVSGATFTTMYFNQSDFNEYNLNEINRLEFKNFGKGGWPLDGWPRSNPGWSRKRIWGLQSPELNCCSVVPGDLDGSKKQQKLSLLVSTNTHKQWTTGYY